MNQFKISELSTTNLIKPQYREYKYLENTKEPSPKIKPLLPTTITDVFNKYSISSFEELINLTLANIGNDKFCIDGLSCCGKTTFLSRYGSSLIKISEYVDLKYRNVDPIQSITYMEVFNKMYSTSSGFVFDRSPVSNIAWLIIPQVYANIKLLSQLTPFGLCELIVKNSKIDSVLRYIKNKNINVLIFIDSEIDLIQERMRKRKTNTTDVTMGEFPAYITIQNYVYWYLSIKLNYTSIDLKELRNYAKQFNIDNPFDYLYEKLTLCESDKIYPDLTPFKVRLFDETVDDLIKKRLIHNR